MTSRTSYPSLADRVTLITGGATGIGADIVRAFARQSAKVAFLDIQDGPAADLVSELDGSAHAPVYLRCDVTDIAALRAAIGEVRDTLGPVSVLIDNAANDQRQVIADVEPEDWDLTQNINLRPHFFAAQAVHPQMRDLGGGAIVNLSSIAWRGGAPDITAYAAAKAAIVGLTRSLAKAYGRDGIRVNAIEPGAVMTEKQRRLWYPTEASVHAMVERQCLARVLTGPDIAAMAVFLASDDARMITKQSFAVDAGIR